VYIKADVRNEGALTATLRGAAAVFHVASYGMSGSTQLNRALVRAINVEGTNAVIRAALAAQVERLVVTSTYNVIFGGQPIEGGDERMPYFPLHRHPDEYSRTKAEAEAAVLAANMTPLCPPGTPARKQRFLRTAAIRPAAIYGPGENRHMPRVVSYLEMGLFFFVFGRKEAKMDFVHVNNLVQAHILAAEALGPERQFVAAGQAYFISDGEDKAINNFEFFGQLVKGLGYPMPSVRLPLQLIYFVAFLTELLHWAVSGWLPFEPLLTRAEVFKAGVSHWFVIDKARKELGYAPQDYPFEEVVQRFRAEGHGRSIKPRAVGGCASSAVFEALMLALLCLVLVKLALAM